MQVLCRMRSLPLPVSFRWTFNNSHEANDVPKTKYSSNGTLSKLNYRAESEKDFGVVHCWATNGLGESTKPCVFTLIPAGNQRLYSYVPKKGGDLNKYAVKMLFMIRKGLKKVSKIIRNVLLLSL